MKRFFSHGTEYFIDDFGVIVQAEPRPFEYNESYVACYDGPEYKRQSDTLQALRLGFVIGAYGCVPYRLVDYGCGNGAFLKVAKEVIPEVRGYDVAGVEIEGIKVFNNQFDLDNSGSTEVFTFWDSLEHIQDLTFLRQLHCNMIAVSLPYCHYHTQGQDWFDNEYKHRKPDEHLRHFSPHSLGQLMKYYGWHKVALSNHEDLVRKSTHRFANILSMAFKRK